MATSIFFNGQLISVPGSYSVVDASGLEQVGLGASGIVAVLGEAEGGIPASEIAELADFIRITKPEKVNETFRSGDLKEAGPMLFSPAKDPDIVAGAQEIIPMKINPAVQSTGVLVNAQGDAVDLTSADYGEFTKQVSVSIADGTTQGKLLTIIFEDVTESVDDLGGDNLFTLQYEPGTTDWSTMTAQALSGGLIQCLGTKTAIAGDDAGFTQPVGAIAMEVVSSDNADIGQSIFVVGINDSGSAIMATVLLNGTTAVSLGTDLYAVISGIKRTGTTAGTVTLRAASAGATVTTLTTGGSSKSDGLVEMSPGYCQGAATLVADGATTQKAVVYGTSLTGAAQAEALTLAGTTPVAGTATFGTVSLALGDVEAARTLVLSATVALTTTAHNTLQKVADFFNAKQIGADGFFFTMVTGSTSLDPDNLDVQVSATDCFAPAEPGFLADLYAIINWINSNSQYVTAERSSGASDGAPSNTASPVFLSGGEEGTSLFSHWQVALNLLKQVRVNSIVVLSPDPAVHAALDAHCAYMGGIGRSERDGFAGLMNTAMDGPVTKTEAKAQVVDLNTRHLRAWPQTIDRYNSAGERTTYDAPFGAAVLAGMQAGSPVGTSLTYKFMNILGFGQHSSWNPTDDAEEMVQAGLVFAENVEGVGRRVVRNITTMVSSSNIAYLEGSVNEAVGFAAYNFRTNMEFAVGKRGFSGTINAAKGVAINTLGLLVDAAILVEYRSLDIELLVDVLEVSCEIAPVLPVNFIKNTLHLVTVPQSAA